MPSLYRPCFPPCYTLSLLSPLSPLLPLLFQDGYYTFGCHYDKIRNHLRETATNSTKIHSLARKYEHLRINQIQLRFLLFNQHSISLLGIQMRRWAYKREKYTFIYANVKVLTPSRKSIGTTDMHKGSNIIY